MAILPVRETVGAGPGCGTNWQWDDLGEKTKVSTLAACGGSIELAGSCVLHFLDDIVQQDALGPGGPPPEHDIRARRPFERGIGPWSNFSPEHGDDQFAGVHDGPALATAALMPFGASQLGVR